jgi:hypothetical protein
VEEKDKARSTRVKTPMEIELHAAKRVASAVAGLSLASRARVLDLVLQHNAEQRMAEVYAESNPVTR